MSLLLLFTGTPPVAPTGASAGIDTTVPIWSVFSVTGTTSGGGTPTTHAWTVVTGPPNAEVADGATLSSTAALSFRPLTAGTWTLRYTASNGAGSTSDDVIVTAQASTVGATGTRVIGIVGDRANPTAGDQAWISHLLGNAPFQVVAIRSDEDAEWAGAADVVVISDTCDTTTLALKYKTSTLGLLLLQAISYDDYGLAKAQDMTIVNLTDVVNIGSVPDAGFGASTVTIFSTATTIARTSPWTLYDTQAQVLQQWVGFVDTISAWRFDTGNLLPDGTTAAGRRIAYLIPGQSPVNFNANGWTVFRSYLAWLNAPSTPAVYIPHVAELTAMVGDAFTRTATEVAANGTISARAWTILSGPVGAGSTLSTAQAVSWTPTQTGNYVLRYSATNQNGVGTYDVPVTVMAAVSSSSYRYYRFQPTDLRTLASANSVQMAELEFWNADNQVSTASCVVTGVGTNDSTPNEVPAKLIDGDVNSKWLNFNKTTGFAQFDFGSATTITAYRIATANDAPERDPVAWTFDGSNDATTWTNLNTQVSASSGVLDKRRFYQGFYPAGTTVVLTTATLSAVASASASISAAVTKPVVLSASALASAGLTPGVTAVQALTASALAAASFTALRSQSATLTAMAAALAGVTTTQTVPAALTAVTLASASTSGTFLTKPAVLTAVALASASMSGTFLTTAATLTATALASAATTPQVTALKTLIAVALASAAVSAGPSVVPTVLAAVTVAQASVSGFATTSGALTATATATATVQAVRIQLTALSASVTASASLSGVRTQPGALTASAVASLALTGFGAVASLLAIAEAAASFTGVRQFTAALSASVTTSTTVGGIATPQAALSASAATSAALASLLTRPSALTATTRAVLSLSGFRTTQSTLTASATTLAAIVSALVFTDYVTTLPTIAVVTPALADAVIRPWESGNLLVSQTEGDVLAPVDPISDARL